MTSRGHVVVKPDECTLTSVPGYIVYSACGSFWVPMLGMIVFYWKIYKTAVAATDAVNRGFVEQKMTGLFTTAGNDKTSCRLRVHRGGAAAAAAATTQRAAQATTTATKVRHSAGCITELVPRPTADCVHRVTGRHSVDAQLLKTSATPAASATPSTATSSVTTASTTTGGTSSAGSQRPEMTSYPVPTIVITSSTSSHGDTEHGVEKNTNVDDVTGSRGDDVSKVVAAEVTQQDVKPWSVPRGVKTGKRQSKSCDDVNLQQSHLLALQDKTSPPSSTRTSTSSILPVFRHPREHRRHQFRRRRRSVRR